jgi:hypothetical protein
MNRWHRLLATALLTTLAGAPPASAQEGYFFEQPHAQLTLHAGSAALAARSDIFDFLTSELTLSRSDFLAPALGASLALLIGDRFDLAVYLARAEAHARSEFRDWLGADGLPIQQDTRLRTVPAAITLRYRLQPRGRQLSRFAWIPASTVPYVGAGAGVTWYRLHQVGEFLNTQACRADPDTGCDIFFADILSRDKAPTGHALLGVERWLSTGVGIVVEARYTRGSAPLSRQFRAWERIDLSGLDATVGLTLRW